MMTRKCRGNLVAFACIAILLGAAAAHAALPSLVGQGQLPTLAPLLAKVTPAVVNVSVRSRAPVEQNPLFQDPFFRRFFDLPRPEPQRSAGSGVIINARKGYVLTNHHVIKNADEIIVTLEDRRRATAKLVGADPGTDIALLQIDADRLTDLPLGDSDALNVGDFVVAIGNPFGLGQTVTSGIVSALGRSGLSLEGYENFIQTDASINPGNSGGPLLNLRGEVVGINTAIIAPAGGNVGIGFAVPSNMAKAVKDQLIAFGAVQRGRLGITIQDLTPDLAEALNIEGSDGAVITAVDAESPAEEAGLRAGDVVVKLNGGAVRSSTNLRNRLGLLRIGEEVTLQIYRRGRAKTITARIGKPHLSHLTGGNSRPELAGATFKDMDQRSRRYHTRKGVLVAEVDRGSPAWRYGLRPGDIIVAVNRQEVTSVAQLRDALRGRARVLALNVLRNGASLFVVIR